MTDDNDLVWCIFLVLFVGTVAFAVLNHWHWRGRCPWWWESCSYGCFHIGRIWILHWDCSMERLFPSTHHICHSLQLREWACFWWRNCTGPHLFQAVWVDGGGLPFVPEACWWLGRTVMELMMMQNSGGIMKQSTVIALCIPISVH